MTDDRRERWESAIRERHNGLWPAEVSAIAATTRAMADAEQREEEEKRQAFLQHADQVNNDLMKEVQRYAEGDEMPVLWSVYNGMHVRALDAEAENARLRASIARVERRLASWEQQLDASLSKQYANLSRIDQERAELPAEERQRLEAGDAPLLRIQLLHMLERARKAERAVNLFADAHRRAEQAEAAGEAEQDSHVYLSTGCLHGEHGYCQAHTGLSGAKTSAVCKFCKAPCQCLCHSKEQS